jgi:hypothetical protein
MRKMKAKAIISTKTNDEPKIVVTSTGAKVEFELYDVSVDELKSYCEKELLVSIEDENNNKNT